MKKFIYALIFFSATLMLNSCGVNSYVMFKVTNDDVIVDEIPMEPTEAYRLAPDDKFDMRFYVEGGKRLIDLSAGVYEEGSNVSFSRSNQSGQSTYRVRQNGKVELPILGLVDVGGMSIIEVQEKLKELYSEAYIDPYIQIEVTNRRVIVFPGSGGSAKVVSIQNDNTTLMEALALAGGITERGKARDIKIMRQTEKGREVYQIDLSTLDGLIYADMVVQANDYIYVEPTKQLSREFLKELSPIVSLISTAMLIVTLVLSFK